MKRSSVVGVCAAAGVLLAASVAWGATISDVLMDDFDPTQDDFALYAGFGGNGPAAYLLTWDNSGGNQAPGGHSPGGLPQYGPPGGNPPWLKFTSLGGGGGGGGGGGAAGGAISTFVLGNNLGGTWVMDFYVLIYDADFAGTEVNVYVIGEDPTDPDNSKMATVDAAGVTSGKMLKFHIDCTTTEGEEVTVYVEAIGDVTYAAAFFMDNEVVNTAVIPEPATLALVALGAVGCVAARRRR